MSTALKYQPSLGPAELSADTRAWTTIADLMETSAKASGVGAGSGAQNLDARVYVDRMARDGLPVGAVEKLIAELRHRGGGLERVVSAIYSARRQAKGERLSTDESGKILRLACLIFMAIAVFGDAKKAGRWMREPRAALDGLSPQDAMQTETGGQMVEELLTQLESGYFA